MSRRKLSAAGLVGLQELTDSAAAAPGSPTVTRITPEPGHFGDAAQLVVNLPLTSIKPNAHQPRRKFAEGALRELAASIKQHGRVLQPILVRPAEERADDDPAAFELVAGERRWRASALAELTTIRAIVDGVDNATSAEMALAENMARDDLSPIEEARGCAALRDSFGLSIAEIGRRVGRDRTAISHRIRLLELPDNAQELIDAGELSESHGRVLLRQSDYEAQKVLARRCAADGWSVRELERQVDASNAGPSHTAQPPADQTDRLRGLTERLAPLFGSSPVSIVPRRRGSYEIRVRCEDLGELTATVTRLSEIPDDAS